MSERVSRGFRSSIGALLFGALAVGGISVEYLAARWNDRGLTSQVDAQHAPRHDRETTGSLVARVAMTAPVHTVAALHAGDLLLDRRGDRLLDPRPR